MRPFRKFRQQASGGGSPAAQAQGWEPEAVRLKALQDQMAAWAYDTDQMRALQRAVLAKMHGLGTQQAATYGTPFPGSSTTTNNTTTTAGVSASGITGILTAMIGSALIGALLAQSPAAGSGGGRQPPIPNPPATIQSSEEWQLIAVPAAGESHEP
jgi:hypothetical protein